MENFNEKLKKWFAGQGMTQGKVAEKIGLSRTIVSNYLNGQRRFGKLSAHRWSEAFNIDPVWLLHPSIVRNYKRKCPIFADKAQTYEKYNLFK